MVLAESYLMKNKSVAAYIQLTKEKKDLENYKAILAIGYVIFQLNNIFSINWQTTPFEAKKELIAIGMKQNLYVRQAIAETLTNYS